MSFFFFSVSEKKRCLAILALSCVMFECISMCASFHTIMKNTISNVMSNIYNIYTKVSSTVPFMDSIELGLSEHQLHVYNSGTLIG